MAVHIAADLCSNGQIHEVPEALEALEGQAAT